MKKLLFILLATILFSNLNAQCTVATFSYSQGFEAFNGVMPTCWTTPSPSNVMSINTGGGAGGTAGYLDVECLDGATRYFVMPKVVNANGILNLKGKRIINANSTRMEVGIMTNPSVAGTFSVMSTVFLNTTNYGAYSINLSSYTGTGQYIAIRISPMSGAVAVRAYLDDINYTSFSGTGNSIFVDKDATGSNDGTSWTNAYTDLNNALANTTFNLGQEIWIAEGIYKPHASNRSIAFALPHNAKIYGGFAGTETLKSQRNPTLNVVTLSGDLNGDDNTVISPTEATRQDNSCHIFTASGEKRDIIIDGVTLSGANANTSGNDNTAGVILMTHIAADNIISVTLTDVIIEKNTATNAAIFQSIPFAAQGSTSILNLSKCTVRNNVGNSVLGNMLYVGHRTNNQKTYGTITNSLFYKNSCPNGYATIYNKVNNGSGVVTPLNVRNCTFSNNNGLAGGVIYLNSTGDSKYTNNIFYGNGSATPIGWSNSGVIASVFNSNISEDPAFGINQNPLFKDAANDDYSFDCSGNSPAINTGNSSGISALELDYAGNPRLVGTVDIGAYEYKSRLSISATSTVVCLGNSVTLTANNGTGINWFNGVVDGVSFSPTTTQTYTVTGTNPNLCSDQATINIAVETSPTITVNSGAICAGKSFTITPSGASTYTIQGGSAIKTPTASTTYTVVGTSTTGCISSAFATTSITVNANPTITVNSGSICPGQSFTINPSGASTYTIQGSSAIKTPTTNTTYTVTGTDINGCISQSPATSSITLNSNPTITANNANICYGSSYTIVPSGASTYTFSNGSVVSPTVSTTYTVTGTGANGCTNSVGTTVTLIVNPPIMDVSVAANSTTICSGKSTTITTGSSEIGKTYYLRNDANNAIIAGPIAGTGSALAFNTGSLTTSATFNVFAETQLGGNYALDFDGTNDVITTNLTTSATNSLTVEAWVLPRATTYRRIISTYNATSTSGEIILDTYNTTNNGRGLRFVVEGAGNTLHQLSIANVLTLNVWNHVSGTFSNGVTKLYVNGTAVATSTAPFTSIPSCTNKLTIGEDPTIATAEYFNGKIDEVRIWNTARTQTEIAGNMNNCLAGNESGLINYFKIYENAGSTVTDLVTKSVGTMSGMDPNTDWGTGNVDCGGTTCDFEMTNLVTINITASPSITVNSGAICKGNSFTITPSGANTYTIQGGSAIKTPTANATYTVTGTDISGCVSSSFAISTVTVNPLPTINATTTNTLLCSGQTASLTANGAVTYTWNPGGIGSSISVTPTITSTYSVAGTDMNGCENNAVITQSVSLCTGIDNITTNNNTMTLFPNPSSSNITIQTIEEIKAVYIFNTLGDLVRTEKTNTFSVEQLSPGIYMIHVKTEKGINTLRFIRE
ncbi:MAG: T9SS type A sorting domain-containing protein [Bacteroidia bacterium]|nr:T9SS type A sorting domain-containing protein [Bacteroidia bacterium]